MIIKNPEDEKANPVQEVADKNDEKIENKRKECTLSEKMQKLMLRQVVSEMYNHNVYRSFANFYGVRGFSLLEEYYNRRAQEEMNHELWFLNYLSETDTEFKYPEIPAINETWENLEDPFDLTVSLEISTTNDIEEMIDLALEEGDYFTYDFLMGDDPKTGRPLKEQREEEATSRTVRDIAYASGSWLRKEKSILDFYEKAS